MSYFQKLQQKEFGRFGYVLSECEFGLMLYHPESLFFVRAVKEKVEFGYTIRRMTYIERLPEDLWKVQPISSCEIEDEHHIASFIERAFLDYEDYALQIPLKLKVKKIFYNLLRSRKVEITAYKDKGHYSEVNLKQGGLEVVISRDYWTERLSAVVKVKPSEQFQAVGKIAKTLGLDEPIVNLTSSSQASYLKFVKKNR
jgi:hypothetical protein